MRFSDISLRAGTIIHVSLSIRRATSEKSDVPEREIRRENQLVACFGAGRFTVPRTRERATRRKKRCGERGGSARWELRKRMEEVNVVGPK